MEEFRMYPFRRMSLMKRVALIVLGLIFSVSFIVVVAVSIFDKTYFVVTYSQSSAAIRYEENHSGELYVHYMCHESEAKVKETPKSVVSDTQSYEVMAVFGNSFDCLLYVGDKASQEADDWLSGMLRMPAGVKQVTVFNHWQLVTATDN